MDEREVASAGLNTVGQASLPAHHPRQHSDAIEIEQAVSVDFSQVIGRIKPLNDLHSAPLCARGAVDLSEHYRALGVNNIRLHDAPWTFDCVQDINYVFPRFDADPEDPANYDFFQTDHYVRSAVNLGANVIFRLGYSAEWDRTPPRHNQPPASLDQWTRICRQVVRHYTQAWAGDPGFAIRYWEIWNEPDIDMFWTGTPDEFYHLFATTAESLREIDPAIKIGGPGLCNNLGFLDGLLAHCQSRGIALDFVSWHSYHRDPHDLVWFAGEVRRIMNDHGYGDSESILDEWSQGPADWDAMRASPEGMRDYFDKIHGAAGAAYNAAVMSLLQDTTVDIATFFSGTSLWWGLFDPYGIPYKAYQAFAAFRSLLDTPRRVQIDPIAERQVTALAGVSEDGRTGHILLSNLGEGSTQLAVRVEGLAPARYEVQVADHASAGLDSAGTGALGDAGEIHLNLSGPSMALVRLVTA